MKEVKLINKEQRVIRAIELVNLNLKEMQDALSEVPEIETPSLDLLCRFEKGLTMQQYFLELADSYIASCTPAPLNSMKEVIRNDFAKRGYASSQLIDILTIAKGIFNHFTYEVGEEPEITRRGEYYAISDKQERRLLDSCIVKLTKLQSEYIGYLDAVTDAKNKVQAFEDGNGVASIVGERYLMNPIYLEFLLENVK